MLRSKRLPCLLAPEWRREQKTMIWIMFEQDHRHFLKTIPDRIFHFVNVFAMFAGLAVRIPV